MSALFAGLSALAYGAADYAGGFASRSHRIAGVLAVTQTVGLIGIVLIALVLGHAVPEFRDMAIGALAGLSGVAGVAMLYRGLSSGTTAVVSPTAALVGTGLPVLAGTLLGETPPVTAWVGIGIAFPAILLLSLPRGRDNRVDMRSLALGVVAGLGFGGYFVLIDQTAPDSGFWPLAAAKLGSLVAVLAVGAVARERSARFLPPRKALVPAVIAGSLDMAANVFFLLAARAGMLATSVVISSMYPAPTVLLARIRDGERLGTLRVVGILLALAGVAFISL